jgi:hypothetical protein
MSDRIKGTYLVAGGITRRVGEALLAAKGKHIVELRERTCEKHW